MSAGRLTPAFVGCALAALALGAACGYFFMLRSDLARESDLLQQASRIRDNTKRLIQRNEENEARRQAILAQAEEYKARARAIDSGTAPPPKASEPPTEADLTVIERTSHVEFEPPPLSGADAALKTKLSRALSSAVVGDCWYTASTPEGTRLLEAALRELVSLEGQGLVYPSLEARLERGGASTNRDLQIKWIQHTLKHVPRFTNGASDVSLVRPLGPAAVLGQVDRLQAAQTSAGDWEGALATSEKGLEMLGESHIITSPVSIAMRFSRRARILDELKRLSESERDHKHAWSLFQRDKADMNRGYALGEIGAAYVRHLISQGEAQSALEHCMLMEAWLRDNQVPRDARESMQVHLIKAACLRELDRNDDADAEVLNLRLALDVLAVVPPIFDGPRIGDVLADSKEYELAEWAYWMDISSAWIDKHGWDAAKAVDGIMRMKEEMTSRGRPVSAELTSQLTYMAPVYKRWLQRMARKSEGGD